MEPTGSPAALIHIKWSDVPAFTFEQTCKILPATQRVASYWRRLRVGRHWFKPDGTRRMYLTVAELGRLLANAAAPKGTDR